MIRRLNKSWSITALKLGVASCVLLLLLYNFTFWQHTISAYSLNISKIPFFLSLSMLFLGICFAVLSVFSSKYLFKPFLIFILLLSAISAYAMDTYGYIISHNTLQNILETDQHEVFDLFSLKLAMYIFFLFVIPVFLIIKFNIKYQSLKLRVAYFMLALLLIVVNVVVFNKHYTTFLRNHKELRYYFNPIRPLYVLAKFAIVHNQEIADSTLQILDPAPVAIKTSGKPKLVILVIGESDRAMNHSLNGYSRQTNPLLSLRSDVYSFQQFASCGTETSVSVPCMFSAFTRDDFTYAKGRYSENVLDLLQKSQVQVLWRDNDSGCKNVCDRVPTDDFNYAKLEPYCNSFECHDEILLHDLQAYIDAKTGDKLIVLHKKGNHGPAYYKRYPDKFAVFGPVCDSNELQDCSKEQIVNAYDNIIVYTDYFLDKLIAQLQENSDKYQTAMIYVSDHGESLGEGGIYLHAMPYWIAPKEQTHVPFIFWASDDFALNRNMLEKNLHKPYSHDYLFHTMLGMFKVQSVVYNPELDMFKS